MGALWAQLQSKTFRLFLLRNLLVFMLPFLVLILLVGLLATGTANDMRMSNKLMVEQFKSGVDSQIYSVIQLSGRIASNPAVLNFSTSDDLMDNLANEEAFITLRSFLNELSGVSATNSAIQSAYIYSSQSDKVLSSRGIQESRLFYRTALKDRSYDYEVWKDALLSRPAARFISFEGDQEDPQNAELSYVMPLALNRENRICLVMTLNMQQLWEQAALIAEQHAEVLVLHEGEPIFTAGQGAEILDLNHLMDKSGEYYQRQLTMGEEKQLYGGMFSEETRCNYLVGMPYRVYARQQNQLLLTCVIIFVFMVLGGGWLIYTLARRAYRPIDEILGSLQGQNQPDAGKSDAFAYIRSAIVEMHDENRHMENQLYRQSSAMSGYLISRLLLGNYHSLRNLQENLALLDIRFPCERFIAVLVWSDGYYSADEEEVSLLQAVNVNVFGELLGEPFATYPAKLEGKTALLLSVDGEEEAVYAKIAACIERGRAFVQEHFAVSLYVTASGWHSALPGVCQAYREAEQLMEQVNEERPVIFMWEWERESRQGALAVFSTEWENKLNNLLMIGEGAGAKKLLREALAQEHILYGWQREILLADLSAAIFRAASFLNLERQQQSRLESALAELFGRKKLDLELLCTAVELFCQQLGAKEEPRGKSQVMAERVQQYIEAHFTDPELTIRQVADHLGLHVNYLSSLYKKCTGESILDFISARRLSYAKELLGGSKKRVEEIARLTGYYNSNSFIRAFKKYEGITPGQYRTMRAQAQEGAIS